MFGSLTTFATTFSALVLGVASVRNRQEVERIPPPLPSFAVPQLPPPLPRSIPAKPQASARLEPMPLMDRKPTPHVVSPAKAVILMIKYLQDTKCTGVFAASEIDDMWDMAVDALNLFPIPHGTIRSELQGLPGAFLGRRQLTLEFGAVSIRTGLKRATLYRIPDRGRSVAGHPGQKPSGQPPSQPASGQRPGRDENFNETRKVAA